MLRSVHPDFDAIGVSGMGDDSNLLCGRPHGGVGILVRKTLLPIVKFQTYDDKRLVSITLVAADANLFFLNVYMPYQCDENYSDYLDYLGKIVAILDTCPTRNVCVVGDFNANVNSKFEKDLLSICEQASLVVSDYMHLGRDSGCFTYVSDAHSTTSWLDHYICSHDLHTAITCISVLDKLPCSDHLPLRACFSMNVSLDTCNAEPVLNKQSEPVFKWSTANTTALGAYAAHSAFMLAQIPLPAALNCSDPMCQSDEHKRQLDRYYTDICTALRSSSEKHIGVSKGKCAQDFIVPGFNDFVKELHTEARHAYIIWRSNGKPRFGPTCELMRRTRLNFKYALRQCQRSEDRIRADAMAESLDNGDAMSFWRSVKKVHNKAVPLAAVVDGNEGTENIGKMWRNHFSALLNSVPCSAEKKSKITELMQSGVGVGTWRVLPGQVLESIRAMKRGKACGIDGLAVEHFIHASRDICVHLSLLFTGFLLHGHLPALFMNSAIVPLIKNKSGDSSDKGNYRPIALVTPCSKIFERLLLDSIDHHLVTSDNQFGFKRDHSTDLCIYTLKSVIQAYKDLNSPVYTCFLDASKAFDRVDHWVLFEKLIARGVPLIAVRLLIFWYQAQLMCVKWGHYTSTFFPVTNGVRQGSILSPKLFSLYMDGLSNVLLKCNAGCYVNNACVNHVFYADDLCLVAPSPSGLQKLLDCCAIYGTQCKILFNPVKTHCMVFKPKKFKLHCPDVKLCDTTLQYVSSTKYLGFILHETSLDDEDMIRQMRLLYMRANILLRDFFLCSAAVKVKLFISYCLAFYCPALWVNFKVNSYEKLRVAFNNVHRKLLGYERRDSASQMFVSNNLCNFEALLRKTTYSFVKRLQRSSNVLIRTVSLSHTVQNGTIYGRWNNVLYNV